MGSALLLPCAEVLDTSCNALMFPPCSVVVVAIFVAPTLVVECNCDCSGSGIDAATVDSRVLSDSTTYAKNIKHFSSDGECCCANPHAANLYKHSWGRFACCRSLQTWLNTIEIDFREWWKMRDDGRWVVQGACARRCARKAFSECGFND